MLTEEFVAATQTIKPQPPHTSTTLKDVGIFLHEFQPQTIIRHGFKKSSILANCLAVSDGHIFAAQADKAVVNVYNRSRGNQEATVPFPYKITSLLYLDRAAILVLGTHDGKLLLWEVTTGRVSTSAAAHLEGVSVLVGSQNDDSILSASTDSSIHVWHVSELVSFSQSKNFFNDQSRSDSPLATFSQHRTSVSALALGHSNSSTNIAVSASVDKVCYVWHIQSCQVLRTVLLAEVPRCLVLDKADRAIYIGSENGSIQRIDLLSVSTSTVSGSNRTTKTPLRISASDCWKPLSNDLGPAQCATLSYDGTSLLTGHSNGKVICWDVAKKRVMSELTELIQSVTNIQMIQPARLHTRNLPFIVPTITKPRLELSATGAATGTLGLPLGYTAQLQVQVCQPDSSVETVDPIDAALMGNGFAQSILDDAIQAMLLRASGTSNPAQTQSFDADSNHKQLRQVERLEDELAILKTKLAVQEASNRKNYEKHLNRMKKRDALGFEKRQAFFAAKKFGKDGDAAMKPFAERELALDAESDDEIVFHQDGD